jgi:hypothetical protein
MGLFGKPTLAQIYIKELRSRLDGTLVPLFSPDVDLPLGAIGRFGDKRQFVWEGRTLEDEFGIALTERPDVQPSEWVFASEGAVQLTPEGTVSVGGVKMLQGKLSFIRDRAVVASFRGMTGTVGAWTADLNRRVWELYLTGSLEPADAVVWTVLKAQSGTVIISRKSGTTVELAVDPALAGALLSLQGLAAGVTFTGGQQAAIQITGPQMTPFVRLKGVGDSEIGELANVKGFEDDAAAAAEALEEVAVPDLDADAVAGPADWDEAEEGGAL